MEILELDGMTVPMNGTSLGIGEHLTYKLVRSRTNLVASARYKSVLDRIAIHHPRDIGNITTGL